ncbi:hypothetical protein AC579_4915 [Pseudocercospora musae]|uniref:Fms interacting protein n=1 Tax=Pseudocercospora musae TaxID=113226 RepID=A0A139IEF7_9PEZI|nr:hypothetical protein AC579_4915 [Pseudocercospora musae]
MTSTDLITDPTLLSVLAAAAESRRQCLEMLTFIEQNGASAYESDELNIEQKKLASRLAILRGLNRNAVMSVRATKQETTEARQEIDSLHLTLQNLYYEQRHLRGEISACEDYDHKYLSLPMIPTEDFLAAHPQYIEASDHDLTIARINDEHEARRALEEQRLALMKRKLALEKETLGKKEELARLDLEIERWIGGQSKVLDVFKKKDEKLAAEEKRRRELLEKEEAKSAETEV